MDEAHWGLTGRPFQLTPDPHFWFETATHRKAMAYLGYGLAQGEGFVVITGEIGAGKTTLIGHLLATIDPADLHVVTIVSSAIEPADLLRLVATQLGVDPAGLEKAELLTAIERGLHAVARTGKRTLLVVDEAQALPVTALEELRMLSNFQAGGHALLQIMLLGQPEFRERLHGTAHLEQLRQRVIAMHHLDAMGEDEVADYVAHRLALVGWNGRPDFAADAFPALYAATGGVPRRVNLLAGRVMLHAAITGAELIDAALVEAVAADMAADMPAVGEPVPAAVPQPELARFAVAERARAEAGAEPVPVFVSRQERSRVGAEPDAERVQPERAPPAPVAVMPDADTAARLAELEARLEQQDAALRRVLTLLVDWVEADTKEADALEADRAPHARAA